MKVLLIDDHPLILSALQNVIQGMGSDVGVVGVAGARAAREALAADDSFDLVLLDLRLGDADGFDVLVELRNGWPAIPVVVVSASDRSADVIRAIDLGAMGFVPKRASNETLTEALKVVMSGGIYVPPMTMGDSERRRRRCRARQRRLAHLAAGDGHPAADRARQLQADAAPDRRPRPAAARPVEQADRARARPLGRDRQGPRRRGAARARRQLAHPGGPRREPDVEPGSDRAMAHATAPLSAVAPTATPAPPGAEAAAATPGEGDAPLDSFLLLRDHVRGLFAFNKTSLAGHAIGAIIIEMIFAGVAPQSLRVVWGTGFADRLAAARVARGSLRAARAALDGRPRAAPARLAGRRARLGRALGHRRLVLLGVRQRPAPGRARPRRLHLLRRLGADPRAAATACSSLFVLDDLRAGDRPRRRSPAARSAGSSAP